jgi:hypothetical protein
MDWKLESRLRAALGRSIGQFVSESEKAAANHRNRTGGPFGEFIA